ncbi:tail fiber assembly protein [Photorhabdus bodei]|nr:tail fiber assembly protein [Photorhabdus sp. CRI-LC]
MAPLQYAVDLNIATDEDETTLLA